MFDCAENDRPFYIPNNGEMKLQFFNVSDLCRFIEILLNEHPKEKVFNVGNKKSVSIKEWVSLCYRAASKEAKFVSVDSSINQRDYFPFYSYEYEIDVSKMETLMKDTISLFYGLKEEYEWYRDNKDSVYNRKPYLEFIDNNLK